MCAWRKSAAFQFTTNLMTCRAVLLFLVSAGKF